MKKIFYSTQMKKDLKKYRRNEVKMKKLYEILEMLINNVELPEKYKKHKLLGQYNDCLECHIEGDFLLIWIDEENDLIELIRLGSHSELFD